MFFFLFLVSYQGSATKTLSSFPFPGHLCTPYMLRLKVIYYAVLVPCRAHPNRGKRPSPSIAGGELVLERVQLSNLMQVPICMDVLT